VGTAKRERQKANRQLKAQQQQKAVRAAKTKRWGLRLGIGIPVVLGAMFLLSRLVGDDDSPDSPAVSTTVGGSAPAGPTSSLDPTATTLVDVSSTVAGDTTPSSTAPVDTTVPVETSVPQP
jgi:hypothetical protein